MKYKWLEQSFTYDGTQLRSLFGYLEHGVLGDSILSWRGPCEISFEHMVDGEDLLQKAEIKGSDMLHFIVEIFEKDLFTGVSIQRLLSALARETLQKLAPDKAKDLSRDGDDLWLKDQKLSISIATKSPVSSLIHFALNISNEGTPVKTLSLTDLDVDPIEFSKTLAQSFTEEYEQIKRAVCKVRWVK